MSYRRIGSSGHFVTLSTGHSSMVFSTEMHGSFTNASLSIGESAELANAIVRAMWEMDPDYQPPSRDGATGADVRDVPTADPPLVDHGEHAGDGSSGDRRWAMAQDMLGPNGEFCGLVDAELFQIYEMLRDKNVAYGDSVLSPVRCFSRDDKTAGIRARIDDKLSRIMRGEDAGEDTTLDLIGYLVMLRIAEKQEAA